MAMILEFPARGLKQNAANGLASGDAEIIIFPGVRYEHWEDTQPQKKRARAKPKRDRLEIPD
jgi:hypothetical protein